MDDIPPVPPNPPPTNLPPSLPVPGVPVPKAAPAKRPGAVTGAGGILLVAGVLSVVVGTVGLVGKGLDIDAPFLEGESSQRVAALMLLVQGTLALIAGWMVLRLLPAGRVLGIVVATLGIVTGLMQLRSSGPSGFLALALDAFVLYALFAYGFVFRVGPPAR
jgi:hypothetical protein